MNRAADQFAAVRNEHHLVLVRHGTGGDDIAVPARGFDIDNALPAPRRDAVFVGRRALAIAILRHGENELFLRGQLGHLVGPERRFRHFPRLVFGPPLGVGISNVGVPVLDADRDVAQDRHADDRIALGEFHAAHARRGAALEDTDRFDGEPDALSPPRGQQDIVVLGTDLNADDAVPRVELHGDLAVRQDVREIGQGVTPHIALRRGEHKRQVGPLALVLGQGQQGLDGLALRQGKKVHHGLAPRRRCAERQAVGLHLIDLARRRKEQHRRMGVHHEDVRHEVVLTRAHARTALAAAALRAVGRERHALEVAGVAERYDHLLALDQVFFLVLDIAGDDLGAPRRAEFLLHLDEFVAQDLHQAIPAAQDVEVIEDLPRKPLEFVADLVAAQRGEPL